MNYIDIQYIYKADNLPDEQQIQRWIDSALQDYLTDTEIVVRIVDEQESAELNQQYRHKSGPTNILSFPIDLPEGIELYLLGDLVICAPVLEKEAVEQQKGLSDHWAHIIIHGVLHLLGYDHIEDDEAELMENKEITILKTLTIANPYEQDNIA